MNSENLSSYLKASGFFLLAFFLFSAVTGQEIIPIKSLNSPYDEQNPVFSSNGELFFTVGFNPQNNGGPIDFGDIWYSKPDNKGEWQIPQKVSDLSTNGLDVLVGFSDALTAMVYHSGQNGKKQGIHLYSRFGSSWNYLRPLEMGNFKNNGTHFSGRLSLDGNVLIMSMNSFGSFGNEDIYVSFKQSEGVWSSPLNVGSQVNTFAQEHSPYLSDDLQTLYFSSNFQENRRGKDIYYSQRSGSSWDSWTVPTPIGFTNTQGSEMGYVKFPGENNAIFTSTQNSEGFGDFFIVKFQTIQPLIVQVETAITEIPQPLENEDLPKIENSIASEIKDTLKIEKVTVLQVIPEVRVDSVSKIVETIPEETIIETPISTSNRNWNEVKILDAQTQSPIGYKIEISNERGIKREIPNQNQLWNELEDPQWVNLSISSKGFIPQLLDKNSWIESEGKEILLKPAVAGTAIILENIQFNRGTSDFADAKSIQVLDDFVFFLKENPEIKIRLEGHTDNAGDPSLNKDLSMKRASKIRAYLTINGIEFERIRTSGWGGTRPIADNNTEEGRTKNRRVEMLIEN
ncbi:OmpA family protein [Aquiflexum gelatinilyticum]|uniref:OmpA family protein n=1 Tax=Aquiflexum gelatinilyticum TaxID=2961943 RepID=A0A9X2P8M3_9BACT|nr:OmpA family protein [Aquiflexum gelatinilyticum]MCR9015795.1 OmpA family protein [Aquiflexum gelatinilyticum]